MGTDQDDLSDRRPAPTGDDALCKRSNNHVVISKTKREIQVLATLGRPDLQLHAKIALQRLVEIRVQCNALRLRQAAHAIRC